MIDKERVIKPINPMEILESSDDERIDQDFKESDALNMSIVDLLIALVKDIRGEIYDSFIDRILPKMISLVDIHADVNKIFTFFSYSFKFLVKKLIKDLPRFYTLYFELLAHPNKMIRKFASQSFSYLVRKITESSLKSQLCNNFLQPLQHPEKYIHLQEPKE